MQSDWRRVVCGAILLASLTASAFAAAPGDSQATRTRQSLGPLRDLGQWKASDRKSRDAPGSPQVVAPGLAGSQRAALFTTKGSDLEGNTSAQRTFGQLQGDRIVVELTVRPSSDSRNLGIAVRGGGAAAAYLRLGKKKGV